MTGRAPTLPPRPRGPRRAREEGALAAEFVGILPILLLLAVMGWQLLLTGGAASAAATAARNGARAASMGDDCVATASRSLPQWLPPGRTTTSCAGTTVTVAAEVPILFPGADGVYTVSRTAEMPQTPE